MGTRLIIQVNGAPREAKEGTLVTEIVLELKLKPEQIAIELNREVIRRAQWQTTVLRDGDKIEIVHFVGGGC